MRSSLSEATVQKLHDYEASDLPERTKMALRFTDHLAGERGTLDAAFYADLRRHFREDEVLDLGMALGFTLGWQRFIEAFGIRPDGWRKTDPAPWAPREAR